MVVLKVEGILCGPPILFLLSDTIRDCWDDYFGSL